MGVISPEPVGEVLSQTASFSLDGGTGKKLGELAVILAGACSMVATLVSLFAIWLQLKNYRKPLLQRYVVRILLMVPIYAISSWVSLKSITASQFVDPIRDIYEAFTIYTFFQLLINFLGGERALIIMTHGRAPKEHLWPFDLVCSKVDISDPHTFLAIKRGILQYAWLKPVLGLATVVMKATGTYQEGYIGLKSGYFWSGIAYNISVSLSLYCLGMFWVCMSKDLQPFRPVPKFLCIKLIIFASYWQGFALSILVWLGVIHDVGYYTPDNVAAAIQDFLICCELPGFAFAHWYAFSWKDYADKTISAARMPVLYAFRDSFGIRDLIEDSKITFAGKGYEYRLFDPSENILVHEESGGRVARMMEGLRYERGGKGKYWLPKPNARPPGLLSPGPSSTPQRSRSGSVIGSGNFRKYGTLGDDMEELDINEEDEKLFADARKLEHGDYNYPVLTAYVPFRDHRCFRNPQVVTTSTNRAFLNPKKIKRKGKKKAADSRPLLRSKSPSIADSASSSYSARSKQSDGPSTPAPKRQGVVDLVVEDKEAEEKERVRARKEGGPGWNEVDPKVFVRQYPPEQAGEEIRTSASGGGATTTNAPSAANVNTPIPNPARLAENAAFSVSDTESDHAPDSAKPSPLDEVEVENAWRNAQEERENGNSSTSRQPSYHYDAFGERDSDVWGRDD